jgi:hypothetical protein
MIELLILPCSCMVIWRHPLPDVRPDHSWTRLRLHKTWITGEEILEPAPPWIMHGRHVDGITASVGAQHTLHLDERQSCLKVRAAAPGSQGPRHCRRREGACKPHCELLKARASNWILSLSIDNGRLLHSSKFSSSAKPCGGARSTYSKSLLHAEHV